MPSLAMHLFLVKKQKEYSITYSGAMLALPKQQHLQ